MRLRIILEPTRIALHCHVKDFSPNTHECLSNFRAPQILSQYNHLTLLHLAVKVTRKILNPK